MPLAQLKGTYAFPSIGFVGQVDVRKWVTKVDLGRNQPGNTVVIDTRTLPPNEWVYVLTGLVEPGRADLVFGLAASIRSIGCEVRQFKFATQIEPWLFVLLQVRFPDQLFKSVD